MDVNIQVHFASLVNQFLDTTGQLPNPQQDGREQFSWARSTPRIHTFCMMAAIWCSHEVYEGYQHPGRTPCFLHEFHMLELELQTWFWWKSCSNKGARAAVGANFNQPEGQIEPSAFFDEEAEQVRQKFLEEQKEEEEAGEMALHDKPAIGTGGGAETNSSDVWRDGCCG